MALRRTVQRLEKGGGEGEGKGEGEGEGDKLAVTAGDLHSALSSLTPSVSQAELERYQSLRKTADSS